MCPKAPWHRANSRYDARYQSSHQSTGGKLEMSGRCFEGETIRILEGERLEVRNLTPKCECFVMGFNDDACRQIGWGG